MTKTTHGFPLISPKELLLDTVSSESIEQWMTWQGLTRDHLEEIFDPKYYNQEKDLELLNELMTQLSLRCLFDKVLVSDRRLYTSNNPHAPIEPINLTMEVLIGELYGPILMLDRLTLTMPETFIKRGLCHEAIHLEQITAGALSRVDDDLVWGTHRRSLGETNGLGSYSNLETELTYPWEAEAYHSEIDTMDEDSRAFKLIRDAYRKFKAQGHYRYRKELPKHRRMRSLRNQLKEL